MNQLKFATSRCERRERNFLKCHDVVLCKYRDADKFLARHGRKQATATEDFEFHIYPICNHNWRNISTIYIYITRLASNEIFSPSNKIHREVGRDKDLSALRYYFTKQHKLLVLVMQRVFSMTWDCILFCNFYKQAF